MYDDHNYANSRIMDTIVMHKSIPVRVVGVKHNMEVIVTSPLKRKGGRRMVVPCSELNLLNFRLGFLNRDGRAYFLARRTLRYDWRQGLRPANVYSQGMDEVDYKDIAKVLLQRYPSFQSALLAVREGADSMAWCQDFMIDKKHDIYWRFDHVGVFAAGEVVLCAKFTFLKECLEEVIDGCYKVL